MKKQILSKCLLGGIAMMTAMFFNSCQSCSKSQDDCPPEKKEEPKSDCREEKRGCEFDKRKKDNDDAKSEGMTRVIEIDQPVTSKVTTEKSSAKPTMESSEEAKLEVAPAPAPVVQHTVSALTEPANVESVVEATASVVANQ